MRKRYIYGILISTILLTGIVAVAGNYMTGLQKAEEEKKVWAEKNIPKNLSSEELKKMEEKNKEAVKKMSESKEEKKAKEILDAAFNREQVKADKIDTESEKILKRFYKKDITVFVYGEAGARKVSQLIVDALNQKNNFSDNEISLLKQSLMRRSDTLNDPDLEKAVAKLMQSNNLEPSPSVTEISPPSAQPKKN